MGATFNEYGDSSNSSDNSKDSDGSEHSNNEASDRVGWETCTGKSDIKHVPLWTGPSKLLTIRVAKCAPMESLLKPTFKDSTAFKKKPQEGPVRLGHLGFENDEHAYVPHQGPDRAVLQYNPNHYPEWKKYLKEIGVADDERRDALMKVGGFGENIVVEDSPDTPTMDESTMCIGDLVSFQNSKGVDCAKIRLNGPRMPCYKLNHRFGIPTMSKKTQDLGWSGWLYEVEQEGEVEVGNKMVLLERPYPEWPVSRVQYYCYKDTTNTEMMNEALETLCDFLAPDATKLFNDRLTKGMEDMSLRLKGEEEDDKYVNFRLEQKKSETDRVSKFVFERVKKLSESAKDFARVESGSHVRLRFKVDGKKLVRPYSIISGDSNKFTLGIALADNSRGGSAFVHKTLNLKDKIEVCESFANSFALQTENVDKHVFLAGGIGITAFLDHVRVCLENKWNFHLHYMIRNKSDYAFKTLIEKMFNDTNNLEMDDRVTVYTSADDHRCNVQDLLTEISTDTKTHIYVCGSEKLSSDVQNNAETLHIPADRIHVEQFSLDASGDPFTVKTSETHKKIEVNNRQSLLDALRAAGLEIPSTCEAGNCGTCRVKVKCGRVLHKGGALMDDEKAGYDGKEGGEMLSCVSRGVGVITLEL